MKELNTGKDGILRITNFKDKIVILVISQTQNQLTSKLICKLIETGEKRYTFCAVDPISSYVDNMNYLTFTQARSIQECCQESIKLKFDYFYTDKLLLFDSDIEFKSWYVKHFLIYR